MTAVDSLGVESIPSEPIEVIIPSGTNTNKVTLQAVNSPFDSSTSTFNVYRAKLAPTGDGTPANNPQQASSGNTPPVSCSSLTLTDTGSSISGGGGGSGSGNPPPSQLYIKTRVYYQLPSETIWRLGAETNDASQTSLQFHLPHNIQGQQINVQLRNVFRNGYETPAGLAPVASYTIAAAYPAALGIGGAPGANDGLIIGGQHIFTRTGGMDTSSPVNVQGSIIALADNSNFSFSSTTTSLSFWCTAITRYRQDGTSFTVPATGSSGSPAWVFNALSASTTYHFGAYYNIADGTVHLVISDLNSGKNTGSQQFVAQTIQGDGRYSLFADWQVTTPASGSGGGGGGTGGGGGKGDFF